MHVKELLLVVALVTGVALGQPVDEATPDWHLRPYEGPVLAERVVSSLHGVVTTGYQGWFTAVGDGYGEVFTHWGGVDQTPPRCTVDMWPDLTEYDTDELYPTNFRHEDGSVAHVFTSTNRKTVDRHFRWMKEYGIGGAFIQRFTTGLSPQDPTQDKDRRNNAVLQHCRDAGNLHGVGYALMYDTHFDRRTCRRIMADWTRLREGMGLATTNAYMHHDGRPIVSLWGYGFDHRRFDAAAVEELFTFLTAPENGGCIIMLGLPNHWASWTGEKMRLIKEYVGIASPWNVGRYRDARSADRHFGDHWPGDLELCEEIGVTYLPVVFPGFSWTNLKGPSSPLNQIPRRQGRFFWHQIEQVAEYGMDTLYIAMFDEVDEGTAIFKVSNDPPVGKFVGLEGLPTDHYLKLAGQAGRLLRGDPVELPEPLGSAASRDSSKEK